MAGRQEDDPTKSVNLRQEMSSKFLNKKAIPQNQAIGYLGFYLDQRLILKHHIKTKHLLVSNYKLKITL